MLHTQEQGLQRNLTPLNVWALALGSIIGWGAFVMPGNTFLPKAGPAGAAIALGFAALIMISIAFNYSYMIKKYPVAGGEFTYTKGAFGNVAAFVCAWFLGLSYISIVPLNATALALIGRNLFPQVFQWGYLYSVEGYSIYAGEVLLALGALLLFGWMNIRGIRVAGKFQTVLALLLVGCVMLLALGALISDRSSLSNLSPLFQRNAQGDVSFGGIVAVIAVAPWAFVGFDSIPQASEEFAFSAGRTKIIMVLSILFGALLYVVLNTVTAAVVPAGYDSWASYIAEAGSLDGLASMPTFYAARELLGIPGLVILAVALFCAVVSGMIGFYMASSRLLYSVSLDGVIPAAFGKLHSKYHTPYIAIIFIMLISMAAPFFGREVLGWVVDMSSTGAAIGYFFTSLAAFVTMRKNGEGSILMRSNALTGALFSLMFLLILLSPASLGFGGLSGPARAALAVWCIMGAVFFLGSRRRSNG